MRKQVIELSYVVRVEVVCEDDAENHAITTAAREAGALVLNRNIQPHAVWDNTGYRKVDIVTSILKETAP